MIATLGPEATRTAPGARAGTPGIRGLREISTHPAKGRPTRFVIRAAKVRVRAKPSKKLLAQAAVSPGTKTIEVGVGRRQALPRLRAALGIPAAPALLTSVLLLAAFVARVLLALHVAAPWVMPDELLYASTSRSFLSSGQYLFREQTEALRTIYPALISPTWLAASTHTAYTVIKVINAALMTLGAIPLYLWARRLVASGWAVLTVVLYLAIPGFIYSDEILTENAALPATMLALFALALALERPTLRRQLLALGSIVLVAAARLQGVVFLVVLPTAIVLVLLLDAVAAAPGTRRRVVRDKLRRFWPSLGAVVLGVVAYAVYEVARGQSISQGLGSYQAVSRTHYAVGPVLRWSAYHFGELAFSVGLVPVSALIVLFGLACRRATAPGAPERAFLALTTAAVLWIVLEAAAFASSFSWRIEERYMFYLDAPLLLALVIWGARGAPRPRKLVAAAVLIPAAFMLVIPFKSLFTGSLYNDTFGLIPLWQLARGLGADVGEVPLLVGGIALVAGLLFAVIPRSWARVALPAAVGGFLVLSSGSVFARVSLEANSTRHAGGLTEDPSWIDRAVGSHARVELIDTAYIAADPHVVWQAEFWNRSVRRVFAFTGQDPSIPAISAPLDSSGRIRPEVSTSSPDFHPHFVAAATGLDIDGSPIAAAGQLVLWRIAGPLRLRSRETGITLDGWTGATATYTRYLAPSATKYIVVGLARNALPGLPAAHVRVTVDPAGSTAVWERRTLTVPGDGARRLRLPVRRTPFQVVLNVTPLFLPTQYGSPDTRMLGVRVSFSMSR